jgi:hypothetical protein
LSRNRSLSKALSDAASAAAGMQPLGLDPGDSCASREASMAGAKDAATQGWRESSVETAPGQQESSNADSYPADKGSHDRPVQLDSSPRGPGLPGGCWPLAEMA